MNLLIQDFVTAQAHRDSHAPAIVVEGRTMTYGELEEGSNRLARVLRESGCQRGDRICLVSPKTPAAIQAIVGIYKADCVYVPLDPASPPARLARIVRAAEPHGVLVAGSSASQTADL